MLPSELSVVNYAALVNHYMPGAFYPRGGTSEIAFQIVPIIEKYGGRVFVDAPVSQILLNDKGRAHGMFYVQVHCNMHTGELNSVNKILKGHSSLLLHIQELSLGRLTKEI